MGKPMNKDEQIAKLQAKIEWWEMTCNYWREQCDEARKQRDMYAELETTYRDAINEIIGTLEDKIGKVNVRSR